MADESEGDFESLLFRQKKEKKDLMGKIQALKHSVPKGDKKKKKEMTLEIAKLETEIEERHQKEIQEFQDGNKTEKDNIDALNTQLEQAEISNETEEAASKTTRAAKRRAKKAAKEQERERRIAEADIENINSARNVEAEKMKEMLKQRNLEIFEITPDGHCLYNAISHQLKRKNIQVGYEQLRQQVGNYMSSHSEDFLPFLIHSETGELYSHDEFLKYCDDVRSTSAWGGQLELQALSHVLQTPIEVIQADSAAIRIGEEFTSMSDTLRLSYHRHMYGLGEHYNSLVPRVNDS